MGANSTKKEILQILEKCMDNQSINKDKKYLKIEYKFNYKSLLDEEKNLSSDKNEKKNEENEENKENKENAEEDSFILSFEINQSLDDPKLNVKNISKFPYSAIGTISVQFPISEEIFVYTCFLIDTNVVVTLASNLKSKSKGGKAKSIVTSFSKENVKWENIFIQGEEISDKKNDEKDKIQIDSSENLSFKLAVIIYNDKINNEWLGVEGGKKEDFEGRDIYAVFSLKEENDENNIAIDEKNKDKKPKLREIFIFNKNPFFDADIEGEKEEIELISQSPGSPLYYKDYNNGAYVIAIINECFEFLYFDCKIMTFLMNMVNKAKQIRKKFNKGIDEDDIIQLNLEGKNLGPSDIKCLSNFEFKNLRILDLNNNSLKSKGVLYLSQYKLFNSLESLNLNNNKIGDEGLNNIANGFFYKLNSLYLDNNSITSVGIKYLIKAQFINNIIILSLSDNKKIGDTGIKYMKEHKGWGKLSILNINHTGITDLAIDYIGSASMPKLKKLYIRDNKFTEMAKANINALRMNHIFVYYKGEKEEYNEDYKELKFFLYDYLNDEIDE